MGSMSLNHVLEVFGAPLSEEQAWAICYQATSYLQLEWSLLGDPKQCVPFNGVSSVAICSDGSIERCPLVSPIEAATSESQLVASVGIVIFQALDYGFEDAEEHKLSEDLENLIEHMTRRQTAASDTSDDGDEGIENDEEDEACSSAPVPLCFDDVIQLCSTHSPSARELAVHHKAVCRAIHSECDELETFLDKMAREKERYISHDRVDGEQTDHLDHMKRTDWARVWVHMMRELRDGVALRKVAHTVYPHAVKFELTPYEIMMEDIRYRRYTLNKIMVEGNVPRVIRKDPHSIILEFIRSRPPLHPVTRRTLATPPQRLVGAREQVLEAIRSEPRLRPTPALHTGGSSASSLNSQDTDITPSRKVIKPDILLFESEDELISDDDEDEDEDSDDRSFDDKNRVSPSPMTPFSPLSPGQAHPSRWRLSVTDDSMFGEVPDPDGVDGDRRHSTTLCGSTVGVADSPIVVTRGPRADQSTSPLRHSQYTNEPPDGHVLSSLECLSLTIEEVMHIRSVLTKAELESLQFDSDLYHLLDKGKVCFVCKIAKFSFLGNWSTQCRFCKRYICSKCTSKMHIPTEHFEHIPVCTLSPSPLSTPTDVISPNIRPDVPGGIKKSPPVPESNISSHSEKSEGSSPDRTSNSSHVSPASDKLQPAGPIDRLRELARHGASLAMSHAESWVEADSHPVDGNKTSKRAPLTRSATTVSPQSEGPKMNICRECKSMVLRIIQAGRSAKPGAEIAVQKAAPRHFHLDLKPVYKFKKQK